MQVLINHIKCRGQLLLLLGAVSGLLPSKNISSVGLVMQSFGIKPIIYVYLYGRFFR